MSVAPTENFYNSSNILVKTARRPVTIELPNAHLKQYELITALDTIPNTRFIVGACGTKFGKTFGSTIAIVKNAWQVKDSLNWWVSPTYAQAKMAYDMILRLLPKGVYKEYKADLKLVILQPDQTERSVIEFKSGDNPDGLRGFGVKFFVMDEAARQRYESFVSLMTTVTQTMGKGFFISTPYARNWFYDIYRRGEKTDSDGRMIYEPGTDPFPEWFSMRMPSWANPYVDLAAIRDLKKNLPEDVFRQEVGAQFLADSAGVFRGIRQCVRGDYQDRIGNEAYVLGVDLARLRDFSVLTVMNRSQRHVVKFERFNQISWEIQYQKIISTARQYNAAVCIDSTGIGDPIVETIKNAGLRVIPYKIGSSSAKQQLIEKLRVNIEKGRISFPPNPIMVKELESYEYQVSDNHTIKYRTPYGVNDDCVVSLALANWVADTPAYEYRYRNVAGI